MRAALKKFQRERREKLFIRSKSLARAMQLETLALTGKQDGVGNNKGEHIVLSLTSFDKRIHDLYLCIESLFQQSLKADKIIVWLSRENFPGEQIPEILRLQSERGLEIEFRDEDIGSYKKIIYCLEAYPDSLIVTVDDDVMYPLDMLDQLYQAYQRDKHSVHCHRGHQMTKNKKSQMLPYKQWLPAEAGSAASKTVFPTGIAGVLYPPGSLHEEVSNKEAFMAMCPNADDIWLKAMSLKNGYRSKTVPDTRFWKTRFLTIPGSQESSLKKQNWRLEEGNDVKLDQVFKYYDLYSQLNEVIDH